MENQGDQNSFQENICHKIIDAFKMEDMMRAFECDIEYVKGYLLKYIENEQQRKAMEVQYALKIAEMKDDQVTGGGNTKSTLAMIRELETFVKENKGQLANYDRYFEKAKPFIDKNRASLKEEHQDLSDIRLCLNANYGLLLLKLDQSPITEEMKESVQIMGEYLAYIGHAHANQ